MYHVIIVGSMPPVKIRIDTEERYFELQYNNDNILDPIKLPYDDPYDIIKVVEQYTILSQDDIQKIIGVCHYGW